MRKNKMRERGQREIKQNKRCVRRKERERKVTNNKKQETQ